MNRVYKKIGHLIEEISMGPFGSDIKVEYFVNRGVPVLNGANISGFKLKDIFENYVTEERAAGYNKAIAKRGDIVVTHRGTLGQIAYIPEDSEFEKYVISQSQFRVKLKTELINPIYFTYYFHTNEGQKRLLSFKSHVGVPALAQATTNFKLLDFPMRPRVEQDSIAKFLVKLDNKIDINNRINAELEAMVKTLYDYWFVQFDFPDANGKPYKTSGGKMVFNAMLKRDIPMGWSVTNIGSITKTELGGTPSTAIDDYWKDADIPWLSSAETATFPVVSSEQMITSLGIENSAATLLPKGTVVISIVRYIRPSILGIDAATNQSVVGIKENDIYKSSFIYPYFCSEVPRLMGLRTGAQQPHINKGVIDESSIAVPPSNTLAKYYKLANPVFDKIMAVAFQNHELVKLRDWLLPLLMNGQVTVK
jgi:type I restriction enzyme S subunit